MRDGDEHCAVDQRARQWGVKAGRWREYAWWRSRSWRWSVEEDAEALGIGNDRKGTDTVNIEREGQARERLKRLQARCDGLFYELRPAARHEGFPKDEHHHLFGSQAACLATNLSLIRQERQKVKHGPLTGDRQTLKSHIVTQKRT